MAVELKEPKYGAFESNPCRFTETEAWVLYDDVWRKMNSAEILHGAGVMSKEAYEADFGHVPPLPKAAFHSGG